MTADVAVTPKLHPEETPNTPLPIRGGVIGENQVFGLMVPNMEKMSSGGIIMPDTELVQNVPHVFTLLQISEVIDRNKFPLIAGYKDMYDPEGIGKVFIGPQLLYRENNEYGWNFPESGPRWVQIDCRQVLRWFPPFKADLSRIPDEGKAAYERYEQMLSNVKWYIENVQSK